jgi:hypothetical protein
MIDKMDDAMCDGNSRKNAQRADLLVIRLHMEACPSGPKRHAR